MECRQGVATLVADYTSIPIANHIVYLYAAGLATGNQQLVFYPATEHRHNAIICLRYTWLP